jgi:hypothetical protein
MTVDCTVQGQFESTVLPPVIVVISVPHVTTCLLLAVIDEGYTILVTVATALYSMLIAEPGINTTSLMVCTKGKMVGCVRVVTLPSMVRTCPA